MQEGLEICRDRGTDGHTQGVSRACVRAAADGAGEKEDEEGQG